MAIHGHRLMTRTFIFPPCFGLAADSSTPGRALLLARFLATPNDLSQISTRVYIPVLSKITIRTYCYLSCESVRGRARKGACVCVCDPEDKHSPADPATPDTGVTIAVVFVCHPVLARD